MKSRTLTWITAMTLFAALALPVRLPAQSLPAEQNSVARNTLQVGNCKGRTGSPTISAAISAVASGGLILVCPGSYPEQIVISKPLTLTGIRDANRDQVVILPPTGLMSTILRVANFPNPGRPTAVQVLIRDTGDVHISNLTIDGTNNQVPPGTDTTCRVPTQDTPTLNGIYVANASATITNVATRNQILSPSVNCHVGFGILAETSGANVNLTVTDSSIRAYESTGIVADDHGNTATIIGNSVFGNPGTSGIGIRVTLGATGEVSRNLVINGNPSLGSIGIWCDACHGTKISDNIIGDSDDAIVVTSDDSSPSPYNGDADDTTISFNRVLGMSPAFPPDGAFYICSNGNEISGNQISGTAVGPAIMLDNTCTSTIVTGNNNTVSDNSINEACAGVMRNTGTTGNTLSHNRFFNVAKRTATGVACAAPPGASAAPKARLPELR
jgi:hypothetical protein